MSRYRPVFNGIECLFFQVQGRPLEWLCLMSFIGWFVQIVRSPMMLAHPAYAGFSDLPPGGWLVVFAVAIVTMAAAMFLRSRWQTELRSLALAMASALWVVIAVNFLRSDISTTAEFTYSAFAIISTLTTVRVAWKG